MSGLKSGTAFLVLFLFSVFYCLETFYLVGVGIQTGNWILISAFIFGLSSLGFTWGSTWRKRLLTSTIPLLVIQFEIALSLSC